MPHNPVHSHDSPPMDSDFLAEPPVQYVLAPPMARPPVRTTWQSTAKPDQPTPTKPLSLRTRWAGDAVSGLVSLLVHTLILVILAFVVLRGDATGSGLQIVVAPLTDQADPESVSFMTPLDNALDTQDPTPAVIAEPMQVVVPDAPNIPAPFAAPFAAPTTKVAESRPRELVSDVAISDLLSENHTPIGGGFEGRTPEERARLVAERGGSQASEDAVELALAWLAAHQRQDGGWRLNHQDGPCAGRCGNPGTVGTSTGATALALLPFLGAGYTHQRGQYKEVVGQGLYYLTGRMLETRHGGDLQEGTMYSQGLAALTLCEAYAMTGDQELKPYAQRAIDFIVHAQHPRGGWRYVPGAPGDTTVTGWQVMALKSARLAGLYVPSHTTELAKEYLNSVQDPGEVFYGYQSPGKKAGPTSVAILLRMYLGWQRYDSRLVRGASYLSGEGPSKTDMYFNYYATQVLHHHDGTDWRRWNLRMRDYLISHQARSGHENGSWFFSDPHGNVGGRLYNTAICAMILEVYYRHMPLYGDSAVEDAF